MQGIFNWLVYMANVPVQIELLKKTKKHESHQLNDNSKPLSVTQVYLNTMPIYSQIYITDRHHYWTSSQGRW